jgi:transposase
MSKHRPAAATHTHPEEPTMNSTLPVFRCVACNHAANADVNAALNIAAGHAARGGSPLGEPVNREPLHLRLLSA